MLKGFVRAFAGMNLGVFLAGIKDHISYEIKPKRFGFVIVLLGMTLVLFYLTYPFESNYEELSVQWDYLITLFIAIIAFLAYLLNPFGEAKVYAVLGKFSYYCFFGQAVFWSCDKVIYRYIGGDSIYRNYIVTIGSIFILTLLVASADRFGRRVLQCSNYDKS